MNKLQQTPGSEISIFHVITRKKINPNCKIKIKRESKKIKGKKRTNEDEALLGFGGTLQTAKKLIHQRFGWYFSQVHRTARHFFAF